MLAGAISAIYKGANILANPTPIPPRIRYRIKDVNLSPKKIFIISGYAEPQAEITKRNADKINPLRRPMELAILSPMEAPIIQPTSALLTIKPNMEFFKFSVSTPGRVKNWK